jgi:hypothetical protein
VYGCVEVVSAAAPRPEAGTLLADIDAILFSKRTACTSVVLLKVDCEQRILTCESKQAFCT